MAIALDQVEIAAPEKLPVESAAPPPEFAPPPPGTDAPRRRAMVPGTFTILEVGG